MDIEKFIQSKEVREQSISQKEILSILNLVGVSKIPNNINELKPYFAAFKTMIFDYCMNCFQNNLFVNQKFPEWRSKEVTISNNSDIIDFLNYLEIQVLRDNSH